MSQDPAGSAPNAVAAAGLVGEEQARPSSEQSAPGGAAAALPASGPVVLDASFVLALLQRHPGAVALSGVLRRGVLTSITAGEVFAAVAGTAGTDPHRVEGVLRALGVQIVDLSLEAAHHFPHLRRIDAARRVEQVTSEKKATALSLADLCVLGYALANDFPVITGNRHWVNLANQGLTASIHLY